MIRVDVGAYDAPDALVLPGDTPCSFVSREACRETVEMLWCGPGPGGEAPGFTSFGLLSAHHAPRGRVWPVKADDGSALTTLVAPAEGLGLGGGRRCHISFPQTRERSLQVESDKSWRT